MDMQILRKFGILTALGYTVVMTDGGQPDVMVIHISRRNEHFYMMSTFRMNDEAECQTMIAWLDSLIDNHSPDALSYEASLHEVRLEELEARIERGAQIPSYELRALTLAALGVANRPNATLMFDAVDDVTLNPYDTVTAMKELAWFLV